MSQNVHLMIPLGVTNVLWNIGEHSMMAMNDYVVYCIVFFLIVEPSSMCLVSPQFLVLDQIIVDETNTTQQFL
jgi:hypothetical protein